MTCYGTVELGLTRLQIRLRLETDILRHRSPEVEAATRRAPYPFCVLGPMEGPGTGMPPVG